MILAWNALIISFNMEGFREIPDPVVEAVVSMKSRTGWLKFIRSPNLR